MSYVLDRLREKMSSRNVDAVIIMGGANRRYFSGFTGTSGTVFITADEAVFITDSRYTIQAHRQCKGFEIKEMSGKAVYEFLASECGKENVSSVWVDENTLSYSESKLLSDALGKDIMLLFGAGYFDELRMIKSAEEIATMETAARLSGEAFLETLDEMKVGMTELEVAKLFEKHVLEKDSETSFIIVASGENGACPHNVPSERKIAYGDMVTVDFGIIYNGYNSDCTRTFAVGEPKKELIDIYNIVKKAQKTASSEVRPGMVARDVDEIARTIISDAGYGSNFGHALGHSLGLDIHEMPSLNKTNTTILKSGMFVTVEPGIYVENLGGVRIEDTLLVTENGARSITDNVPKDMIIKEF